MDRSTRRPADDPVRGAEEIDIQGVDPTVVDALPDTVLARMLRRALREKSEPARCYANFMNGPKPSFRPGSPDGPGQNA